MLTQLKAVMLEIVVEKWEPKGGLAAKSFHEVAFPLAPLGLQTSLGQ